VVEGEAMSKLFPSAQQKAVDADKKARIDAALAGAALPTDHTPRYSATTIKNHVACKRKTFWSYVVGLDIDPSEAQEEGTLGHAFAERYLREQTEQPASDVAEDIIEQAPASLLAKMERAFEAGKKHLGEYRARAEDARIEEPFAMDYELSNGVTIQVVGTVDAHLAPSDMYGLVINDHKFIKDLKWQLSEDELREDVQCNWYGYVEMWKYDVNAAEMGWVFYQKTFPNPSATTEVMITRKQASAFVARVIDPALVEMEEMIRTRPSLHVIEPSLEECPKYRGCEHKSYCTKSPVMRDLPQGEVSVELKASARARSKEKKIMGLISSGKKSSTIAPPPAQKSSAQTPPKAAPKPAVSKGDILAKAKALAANTTRPGAINPPPPAPVEPDDEAEYGKNPYVEDDGAEAASADAEEQAQEEAKPTRAKKDKALKSKERANMPGANAEHNFWLLIDGFITQGFTGEVQELDVIVGESMVEAARFSKVEHYQLAEFSGGVKNLEAAFAAWLEQNPLTGAVRVNSFSPAAKACLGLLQAHAKLTFTGV
jgi:hypothetical protein